MAKKRAQRGTHQAAAAQEVSATESARPSLTASAATTVTAQEALQAALERLDAVAQEAHAYTQQLKSAAAATTHVDVAASASLASSAPTHKRPREAEEAKEGEESTTAAAAALSSSRLDVFAVTSAPAHRTLCNAVAAFGLQLLPSLEDISRRVTLSVLTPALSTAEAWETLAVLCTAYRAGMAHAVSEVLDSLLREPGVLLLDAPQLVPTWYAETFIHVLPEAATNSSTTALGGLLAFAEDQQMRVVVPSSSSSSLMLSRAQVHTDRAERKLRALADIVAATGAYVSSTTLQQFALRHLMEVVEGGVVPCYRSAAESGEVNVASFSTTGASTSANKITTGSHTAVNSSSSSSQVLRWRVPPAWHAACLQLLETFLFVLRPAVPAQLLVTASLVLNVVSGRLHRGIPVLNPQDPASSPHRDPEDVRQSAAASAPLSVSHAVNAATVRLGHMLHLLRHPVVLAPYQPPQLTLEKAKKRVWTIDQAAATTTPTNAVPAAPAVVMVAPVEAPTIVAAASTSPPMPSPVQPQLPVVHPPPMMQQRAQAPFPPRPPQPTAPAAKVVVQRTPEEEEEAIPDVVLED
jgi:hypothetical protein